MLHHNFRCIGNFFIASRINAIPGVTWVCPRAADNVGTCKFHVAFRIEPYKDQIAVGVQGQDFVFFIEPNHCGLWISSFGCHAIVIVP